MADKGVDGKYLWATARKRQLVALRNITITEVIAGIEARVPDGRYVRAIYAALEKPPATGNTPEDTVQRNRKKRQLFLHQQRYIDGIKQHFGMESCTLYATPVEST